MSITKDSFFNYLENKGQNGYGAAILVKKPSETYYSLLVASETVPSVFGTKNNFEFDLINSPTTGRIEGKMTLDDKEVTVLHHRDNVYRFEKLKGQTLDFLVIDSEFVGYKFKGTLDYRMNDATADILRGTYTITPMSADPSPIYNARPLVQETLCFANVIPDEVKAGDKITLAVVQTGVEVTYTAFELANDGTETNSASAISGSVFTAPNKAGVYGITASATGYAPWTTTVYVVATGS